MPEYKPPSSFHRIPPESVTSFPMSSPILRSLIRASLSLNRLTTASTSALAFTSSASCRPPPDEYRNLTPWCSSSRSSARCRSGSGSGFGSDFGFVHLVVSGAGEEAEAEEKTSARAAAGSCFTGWGVWISKRFAMWGRPCVRGEKSLCRLGFFFLG